MLNLVILGNGKPAMHVIDSLNKNDFNIINLNQDKLLHESEQDVFESFMESHKISLNKLDELQVSGYDMILVVNYNKIVDIRQFYGKKILNIHMGLLPKYRGNNANAWAVINGEDEVGYTLHEITDMLDSGDIYYRYAYKIGINDTYLNARNCIDLDIKQNLSRILLSVYHQKIKPVSQDGFSFVYCTKIKPSDGIISNWDVNSDILVRKSYVFGKPLGTGLRFVYKNEFYEIDKISPIPGFAQSIGVPGSIVYINDNKLWVKTGDTAIEITGIKQGDYLVDVKKTFKIGMRLQNSRPATEYEGTGRGQKTLIDKSGTPVPGLTNYEKEYIDLPFEDILREYRKKNILDLLKKYHYKNFLEIGCGPYPLFKDIHDYDEMVVVEPGKLFYQIVKTQTSDNPKITIINDLVENIIGRLKKKTFNFIVIGGFLHEIDNPESVLGAVRKICSKGTKVYSFVPNARSFHRLLAYKSGIIGDIYEKSQHDELFSRQKVYDIDKLNKLMTKTGFSVIESGSYFIKPFTHNQMVDLLNYKIIDKACLDGFDKMTDILPDMGAEIWNICRVND